MVGRQWEVRERQVGLISSEMGLAVGCDTIVLWNEMLMGMQEDWVESQQRRQWGDSPVAWVWGIEGRRTQGWFLVWARTAREVYCQQWDWAVKGRNVWRRKPFGQVWTSLAGQEPLCRCLQGGNSSGGHGWVPLLFNLTPPLTLFIFPKVTTAFMIRAAYRQAALQSV